MTWLKRLHELKEGYQEVFYQNRRYGLSKSVFTGGKSFKVFAKDLGGTDFISCNVYATKSGTRLKPCEMPEKKVVDFLEQFEF